MATRIACVPGFHLRVTRDNGPIPVAALVAHRCRRWAAIMGSFSGPVVLIIDELGYLLMPSGDAAAMLGRLLDRKCGVRNHG